MSKRKLSKAQRIALVQAVATFYMSYGICYAVDALRCSNIGMLKPALVLCNALDAVISTDTRFVYLPSVLGYAWAAADVKYVVRLSWMAHWAETDHALLPGSDWESNKVMAIERATRIFPDKMVQLVHVKAQVSAGGRCE